MHVSYLKSTDCQHSFCNVHHLRDLSFIVEQYGQAWAAKMKRLLCNIKNDVASTSARHTALPPDRLAYYEAEPVNYCFPHDMSHSATLASPPKVIAQPAAS